MEHCAKSQGMLSFAKAIFIQRNLPHDFEILPGNFNEHSSYGVLEVNSFSGYTIVDQESNERDYCAQLFYLDPQIHFAITCNTKAHNTVSFVMLAIGMGIGNTLCGFAYFNAYYYN